MKLAIEHLQTSISILDSEIKQARSGITSLEGQLTDARNALSSREERRLELVAAVSALRVPPNVPAPIVIDQLQKTQLNGKRKAN